MDTTRSYTTISHPSLGLTPSGFHRVHVEVPPREVGHIVGYDPRVLVMRQAGRTGRGTRDLVPRNVGVKIVDLQNRVQRSIDRRRVESMVTYLSNAMERGTFADWGAIELVTTSEPIIDDGASVRLPVDADYFISDGQHRYCAILDFVTEHPEWSERFTQELTISVLPKDRLEEYAGQEFHDRNYFPVLVRPGKALSVDYREPITLLVRELYSHPVIVGAGGIAEERDTIMARDPRFCTLTVLHRFVRGFIFGRPGLDRGDQRVDVPPEMRDRIWDYLGRLGKVLPWRTGTPSREEYLTRSSVVLSGLSILGYDLYNANGVTPEQIARAIVEVGRINWARTNLSLVGVAGGERPATEDQPAVVAPASGRQAIDATIRFLRERAGVGHAPSPVPK